MLSLRSRDVGHVRWVPDDSVLETVFNQIMASNNHMLIATRGASRAPVPGPRASIGSVAASSVCSTATSIPTHFQNTGTFQSIGGVHHDESSSEGFTDFAASFATNCTSRSLTCRRCR